MIRMADIFVSFRISETLHLAKALKTALEAHGVSTFVCATQAGDDIGDEIAENLMDCKLVLILGSETYGAKTDSPFSTFNELKAIRSTDLPIFLIKTCAEFKEKTTKFHLPSSIAHYPLVIDSKNPGYIPADLVPLILAKYRRANVDAPAAAIGALSLGVHGPASEGPKVVATEPVLIVPQRRVERTMISFDVAWQELQVRFIDPMFAKIPELSVMVERGISIKDYKV